MPASGNAHEAGERRRLARVLTDGNPNPTADNFGVSTPTPELSWPDEAGYDGQMLVPPELFQRVERIVTATPVRDIHTHLYDPSFGSLLLSGIDELLVYHYLVSESFRSGTMTYDRFWSGSKAEQAEWIWTQLFCESSPLSEAARGVVTTLHALGLDPRAGNLASIRTWFAAQRPSEYLERVLSLAGVQSICMTNSPFDPEEVPHWNGQPRRDPRFLAALRIDPLLLDWPKARMTLKEQGFDAIGDRNSAVSDAIRHFLAHWTERIGSRYCMVSLPPEFAFPTSDDTTWILEQAVLPHCREHGQGLALMMGVRRGVNPRLRMAGDGVGRSELRALEALCAGSPEVRFLVTCLSRENQHELVVLARKFPNLHPFGCWWFTNTPGMIEEITGLRIELLGTSFTFQHSDARVLDQLIYKWRHARQALAPCLTREYTRLENSGWAVSDAEIARDAKRLLGGAFEQFLAPPISRSPWMAAFGDSASATS